MLKIRRKQLGLTQREVATKVGLLQAQVSVIESHDAKATVTTLYKALSALGLELVLRDSAPAPVDPTEW
ncbi:MAG: helix-turn-helix domain-containing protein [Steroidobacteraceae bacterium]